MSISAPAPYMRNHVPPPLPSHAQQGSVAATVRALPRGTRPADVWRKAAFVLLRLNASELDALAAVFEDESVSDDARLVVLDLLVGAGTHEAQVVMRRLLALAIARRNNRVFAGYVQRLAILEEPDGATLRFLMSVYAESKNEPTEIRGACAYALGAAAGQAFKAGDAPTAQRASEVLRKDLRSSTDAAEKAALVTALGNGGLPADSTTIVRYTTDEDAGVRAACALALRKISTKETRAQLVSLLADPEPRVAQNALVALNDHRLVDEELDHLADLVLGGRTDATLDGGLLHLVVAQRPRIGSVKSSGALENALRLLLGRAEASEAQRGSGEYRAFGSSAGPSQPFPEASRSPSWTKDNPVAPRKDSEVNLAAVLRIPEPRITTAGSGEHPIGTHQQVTPAAQVAQAPAHAVRPVAQPVQPTRHVPQHAAQAAQHAQHAAEPVPQPGADAPHAHYAQAAQHAGHAAQHAQHAAHAAQHPPRAPHAPQHAVMPQPIAQPVPAQAMPYPVPTPQPPQPVPRAEPFDAAPETPRREHMYQTIAASPEQMALALAEAKAKVDARMHRSGAVPARPAASPYAILQGRAVGSGRR